MIERTVLPELVSDLDQPEITLITGPRQAGKTTLMRSMIDHLTRHSSRSLYLNLDIEEDFRRVQSQEQFVSFLKLQLGTQDRSFVFLDEIQRKPDAGLFLKGLYDMNLPYKFVVSGSGSVELKEKVSEGLAGRHHRFSVETVSFAEFVNHRTGYQYRDMLPDFFSHEHDHALLYEYLQYGGYPRVILSETHEQKRSSIQSIYESFVDKDLKELLEIRNTFAIADILALLSVRIGALTHTADVGKKVSLNIETIRNYLGYLEKVFILNTARPYYTNPESELVKSVMYYFSDLGMRNYVCNRLHHFDPIVSGSMLFQNAVYRLLKDRYPQSDILYWRTKDDAEVDFVVRTGTEILPIEVKFADLEDTTIPRSLYNFIDRYSPEEVFIVNRSLSAERKVGRTLVQFIPYHGLI